MTHTLKLPQTVRSAKRVTGAVKEYISYFACTLEQAQRRVGKAELSGKTIIKTAFSTRSVELWTSFVHLLGTC